MKKNKKDISEDLLSRLAILVLLVIAMFLSFLLVGVIKLNHINHESLKQYMNNRNKLEEVTTEPIEVDTSKYGDIQDVEIGETSKRLSDQCNEGCNLKINSGGITYYYLINKNYMNGKYFLSIVKDNKAIIHNKDIGQNVVNLQILYYFGYLTFYNTYVDQYFSYDYAVSVDSNNNHDEFISLNSNEMEFTANGLVYYYDLCEEGKSYKIKAVRKPLSGKTTIMNQEEVDFPWCESVK